MGLKAIISASLLLISCISEPVEQKSNLLVDADFSETLVIGGSISAGFRDNGLYQQGIVDSYPNLIAKQLQAAGLMTKFSQPLFEVGQENGTGYNKAYVYQNNIVTEYIGTKLAIRSTNPLLYTKATGTFNNIAIPAIQLGQLGRIFDSKYFNPLLERILPEANQPYLSLIQNRKISFFVVEMGVHDVLDYALAGGTKSISNDFSFVVNFQSLMNIFTTQKAKGIVLNIPDVLKMPYFQYFNIETAKKLLNTTDLYIVAANGSVRKVESGDMILWKAQKSIIDAKLGSSSQQPLSNELVLDKTEVAQIQNAISNFNTIIKKQVADYNYTLVDIEQLYNNLLTNKYQSNENITVNGEFPLGGFFSLDGIYPTPRGQAIIANECIKALNGKYNVGLNSLTLKNFNTVEIR